MRLLFSPHPAGFKSGSLALSHCRLGAPLLSHHFRSATGVKKSLARDRSNSTAVKADACSHSTSSSGTGNALVWTQHLASAISPKLMELHQFSKPFFSLSLSRVTDAVVDGSIDRIFCTMMQRDERDFICPRCGLNSTYSWTKRKQSLLCCQYSFRPPFGDHH